LDAGTDLGAVATLGAGVDLGAGAGLDGAVTLGAGAGLAAVLEPRPFIMAFAAAASFNARPFASLALAAVVDLDAIPFSSFFFLGAAGALDGRDRAAAGFCLVAT